MELENHQDKDTIATLNRNFQNTTDNMRMQMQADFQRQNEEMMANNARLQAEIQSRAHMENQALEVQLAKQKEYANWQEQQRSNTIAMNKQILQLQSDLQKQQDKEHSSTSSIRTKRQRNG